MAAKKKARPKAKPRSEKIVRIDLVVEAQKMIVTRVGQFVEEAADMTMKGEFSPSVWMKRSALLWSQLATDLAKVTRKL